MVDPIRFLSPRVTALAAFVFFAPVVVTFALAPRVWWADYPGILFHLSMYLLVAKGMLTLNNVPHDIADYVRPGGHIFAGIWIATAALSGSSPMGLFGLIAGIWLAGYTFVSPFLPMTFIGPTSIFLLI